MALDQGRVFWGLRRAVLLRDGAGLSDGELLECYLRHREETALAALVRRHSPMVWGVCRRVLGNHHDAEDAFQATFLVLVRKAPSIMPRQMVGNWLYGVASHTALKARTLAARRRTRERQVTCMPEPEAVDSAPWDDLQPLLDHELSRLPDKYRAPIVLCDLGGKTYKEAARQLGCPEGTLSARLARARAMLAKRLTRHGLALSGGSLAVALAVHATSAGAPAAVISTTIKAASLFAAGKAAATGVLSLQAVALTEGVLKAMLLHKLKVVTAVLLTVSALGAGVGSTGLTGLSFGAGNGDGPEKTVLAVSPQQSGREDGTRRDADVAELKRRIDQQRRVLEDLARQLDQKIKAQPDKGDQVKLRGQKMEADRARASAEELQQRLKEHGRALQEKDAELNQLRETLQKLLAEARDQEKVSRMKAEQPAKMPTPQVQPRPLDANDLADTLQRQWQAATDQQRQAKEAQLENYRRALRDAGALGVDPRSSQPAPKTMPSDADQLWKHLAEMRELIARDEATLQKLVQARQVGQPGDPNRTTPANPRLAELEKRVQEQERIIRVNDEELARVKDWMKQSVNEPRKLPPERPGDAPLADLKRQLQEQQKAIQSLNAQMNQLQDQLRRLPREKQ